MSRKPKATDESTALIPAPLSLSLYDIEDNLQCLMDSAEIVQDEDQRMQVLNEIAEADAAGKHKRDGVAKYIRSLDAAQDAIAQEITYLQGRKKALANHEERLRAYVIGIIEQYGTSRPGKQKELKGNIHSLQLRQNPPSIVIEDKALIPAKFKSITITIYGDDWESLREFILTHELNYGNAVKKAMLNLFNATPTVTISKRDIAEAIEAGEEVPGADLKWGESRLSV